MTALAQTPGSPVRVNAVLDAPLSRWLRLVKWILVIPHYLVLFFLWIAFTVVSVIAFLATLITDTYPPFRLDMGGTEPSTPEDRS